MSSIDDFPRSVTILTSLEMPVAADRLRAMVHDRPAIEDQRHWLSERCVSGRVDGTDVRADVRYRYIGRWYAPNSWTVGFKGKLVDDEGRASLHGEVKYVLREATGGLRLIWLMAILMVILAVVIALEGVVAGRPGDAWALLGVPLGIALLLGLPRLETHLEQRAMTDAAMLEGQLRSTLA